MGRSADVLACIEKCRRERLRYFYDILPERGALKLNLMVSRYNLDTHKGRPYKKSLRPCASLRLRRFPHRPQADFAGLEGPDAPVRVQAQGALWRYPGVET